MELAGRMTISSFMKQDGWTLDRKTLEEIRFMAVERVREGEPAAKVIEAYGFNRTTIYKWLNAALQSGVGIRALRSTKAPGRLRTLTPDRNAKCSDGSTDAIPGNTVWISACGHARSRPN
jgi:hypothetical protein